MFIAILTLLSALSISGVAIFYSVIGLATIFPGAFWPVVIMGSVLEVGKLVTASWLYRNWKQTRFLLKTYLTIAVVVLSLITSMGIFGFLSKAHLEQNLAENTVMQRIEIINSKIESENTFIKRQNAIIDRNEKSLVRTEGTNKEAIEIEKQSLKDVQDKFKTLLTVETNAVKELNDRMKILDKDVSDVLKSNKSFFNEEKAAAELKASQKEERALINQKITEAQERIAILKQDYTKDTDLVQKRIDKLRDGNVDDKSDVVLAIKEAEANILQAQNNIDDLIIDREPLQAKMIKLEAEVGPVKYIASLVVDWGVATEVDTSEAVRWVILIIICVFDPLAVLLLVAANQSLLKRFPVQPLPPEEIVNLEKPDDEDITLKWNEAVQKNAENKMKEATEQLKDWQTKLSAFNDKVEKPEHKKVDIIQEDENDSDWGSGIVVPEKLTDDKHAEFVEREKAEQLHLEEVARKAREEDKTVDNLKDGYDPDEVEGYEEFNKKYETKNLSEELQEDLEPLPEHERIKPDLTEVIEPGSDNQPTKGMLGQRVVDKKGKVVEPPKPILSNWQRNELLDKFHKEHGNFEDYVQNEEQDENTLWNKSTNNKRLTTEVEYHTRVEQRINSLITQIENGEIDINDLSKEDQSVILQIMNQDKDNG